MDDRQEHRPVKDSMARVNKFYSHVYRFRVSIVTFLTRKGLAKLLSGLSEVILS